MFRFSLLVVIVLTFSLTACAPTGSNPTPTSTNTPASITISTVSISASTIMVGTAIPGIITTPLPPNYTPPPAPLPPTLTPIPTLPKGLGPTELKYHILAQYPDFFFCDPDYYPIARSDELALAIHRFPEIQSNLEEFQAILAHNNLAGVSSFSDEQKLLIYRDYKKLNAIHFTLAKDGYQFQIQVAKTEGQGEVVTGIIDGQGKITVQESKSSFATCPICLSAGTLIDTPSGSVPVEDIRVGMLVWTIDKAGIRVMKPVIESGKTVVPADHVVVHLVLSDGRQVWVSPGHPTSDGRKIGQLAPGDTFDGVIVTSTNRVKYTGYATYDLLPEGETGFYWANGILLASTLK